MYHIRAHVEQLPDQRSEEHAVPARIISDVLATDFLDSPC